VQATTFTSDGFLFGANADASPTDVYLDGVIGV
jgi:hypothetical protein